MIKKIAIAAAVAGVALVLGGSTAFAAGWTPVRAGSPGGACAQTCRVAEGCAHEGCVYEGCAYEDADGDGVCDRYTARHQDGTRPRGGCGAGHRGAAGGRHACWA